MGVIDELKGEHRAIETLLRVLEKVAERYEARRPVSVDDVGHVLDFFQVFVDACHHGKEEQLLFPALESAGIARDGGPVGAMLHEHDEGREHIRGMRDAFDRLQRGEAGAFALFASYAREYASLLEQHVRKEDNILFHMAEAQLTPEQQNELAAQFRRLEAEKLGPGRREAFDALVRRLEQAYLSE